MKTPLLIIRKRNKRTQTELCDLLGIDQGHLSRLERGQVKASPELAARITEAFGGQIREEHILFPERFSEESLPVVERLSVDEGWQIVRRKLSSEQIRAMQDVASSPEATVGMLWRAALDHAPRYKWRTEK